MTEPFFILTLTEAWCARVKKSRIEGFPAVEIAVLFDSDQQRDMFIRACISDGYDTVGALQEASDS
jgi:hypothetical protein